jgi:hypothetical protein
MFIFTSLGCYWMTSRLQCTCTSDSSVAITRISVKVTLTLDFRLGVSLPIPSFGKDLISTRPMWCWFPCAFEGHAFKPDVAEWLVTPGWWLSSRSNTGLPFVTEVCFMKCSMKNIGISCHPPGSVCDPLLRSGLFAMKYSIQLLRGTKKNGGIELPLALTSRSHGDQRIVALKISFIVKFSQFREHYNIIARIEAKFLCG